MRRGWSATAVLLGAAGCAAATASSSAPLNQSAPVSAPVVARAAALRPALSMKTLDEALRDHDAAVRACLSTDGVRADQMVVTNLYIPVRGRARPTAVEPASSAEACLEREITGWGLAWPGVDHAVHVIVRLPVPSSAAAAAPPGTPVQAEEIKDVVRKQAGKIQACYTEALGRNPKLEGQVVPSWAIHPDGAVAAVTIESDTIGDDVLATCMALRILDARFPAGIDPAGIVEVSFPFKFTIAREAPKAP